MSLRMFWQELALAISLISLGSNHTLFLPHFMTPAAREPQGTHRSNQRLLS